MSHYDYQHFLGRTWNLLFPHRPVPPMPTMQPRDHALRALFDYLSLVEWRHEGPRGGPPVGFSIPRNRMYEEKVDDNTTAEFPYLAADPKPGSWQDESPPLGPPIVWENTYDSEGVLVELGTYKETFDLQVWTSNAVMRRAILAGMDVAFAPTGDFAGMRLQLSNYFGTWAWFGLNGTTRFDDANLASRRRYGVCEVEMWVPMLIKVPIGFFEPRVLVTVDNPEVDADTPRVLWDTAVEVGGDADD